MFTQSESQTERKGTPPTHGACHVRQYIDEAGQSRGYWTRIGAVWMNADGQGCKIKLDCYPVNGEIVVRPLKDAA